ncbi:MAG: hypothetical protein KGL44_13165 [Sphingomonadales bacterium]|nr:hypothetical protein [Sphingomonadales bacterium]
MQQADNGLCPPERLAAVVEQLRGDDEGGLAAIARLQQSWPLDPRLHFLQGSVLAGLQRYDEGRRAMARAVEIAPGFALARFQLGFLDLTSGRALDAISVWTPLGELAEDDALRVLAEGLANMAVDNFAEARRLLKLGMSLNRDNPMINADMQLILDEIADLPDAPAAAVPAAATPVDPAPTVADLPGEEPSPASAVDMLLRQSRLRGGSNTRH